MANDELILPAGFFKERSSTQLLSPPFIPAWLRHRLAELRGGPISVLLAYISHADRQGFAYPSLGTLCRETGYGLQSVKQGRKLLIEAGLIVPRTQERHGGQFGRKIFQLSWQSGKR